MFVEDSAAIQTVNCKQCHPQHLGDHPVLIKATFTVPKDLPLSKRNEITCMTCHNTHFVRFSDRPWSPRSYKTILFDFVKRKDLKLRECPLIVMDVTLTALKYRNLSPEGVGQVLAYYKNIAKKYSMKLTVLYHNDYFAKEPNIWPIYKKFIID